MTRFCCIMLLTTFFSLTDLECRGNFSEEPVLIEKNSLKESGSLKNEFITCRFYLDSASEEITPFHTFLHISETSINTDNVNPIIGLAFPTISGKTPSFNDNVLSIPTKEGIFTITLHPQEKFLRCRMIYEADKTVENGTFPPMEVRFFQNKNNPEGIPPENLVALGTAGLTPVNRHSGSYMFLTVAHPSSRAGVVTGWLSTDKASGVVFSSIEIPKYGVDNTATITPCEQFGKWTIKPDTPEEQRKGETFLIGLFQDVRLGLEEYANMVAKNYNIKMKPAPTGYCTWYSNKNGNAGSEASTREFAQIAREKLVPYGMNFFQIDDKWQCGASQNGPKKNFTAHNPDGPYPGGMASTAEFLEKCGLTPGIWFMPFSGNYDDPYFADKQDFFIRSAITYPAAGEPNKRKHKINQKKNAPYETYWGGTCLDMSNPKMVEYLQNEVKRIRNTWGYRYFKVDGIWCGLGCEQLYTNDAYIPDDLGKQIFYDSSKTNMEIYRSGLKTLRDSAGDDTFILGCCVSQNMRSLGGTWGYVDAMRVGPDNGPSWNSICRGPIRGTARYFLNGRVWWNDPDPVYVRDSIPLSHAETITTWAAITGQLYAFSDWLPELSEERINVLRRTMPNHQRRSVRPVDILDSKLANIWHLEDGDYHILGLFNWSAHSVLHIDRTCKYLDLKDGAVYAGFSFWDDQFIPPFKGHMEQSIQAASCKAISLREIKDIPVLVSTSRHVASPILDVKNERWDPAALTLSGTSNVVALDTYQLRFIMPTENNRTYVAEKVTLSTGEKVDFTQKNMTLRVTFTPQKSGCVSWSVKFKPTSLNMSTSVKAPRNVTATGEYRKVLLKWDAPDGDCFSYLIERDDGKTFKTASTLFWDISANNDSTIYKYKIYTQGWGDLLSSPAGITVKTQDKLTVPPTPPIPDINLVTLKPVFSSVGWGKVGMNSTCAGESLIINGKEYKNGLGVHAPSILVYAVPQGVTKFVATVGLDDSKKSDDRRSIIARIYTDPKEMGEDPELVAESPVLKNDTSIMWHFNILITDRTKEIRLVIHDAEDGINSDHADWVNAGFIK